jgi:hypothetical protein
VSDMDDWDDDLTDGPQEEPRCFSCSDSGIEWTRRGSRRCRECRPTRLQAWYQRARLPRWRHPTRADEPPFDPWRLP